MQSRLKEDMNLEQSGRERRSRIAERGDSSLRSVYNDPLSNYHIETTPPSMHLDRPASRTVSAIGLVLALVGMSRPEDHPPLLHVYAVHLPCLTQDQLSMRD